MVLTMAYLVCYSRSPPNDHTRNKAIYLDQRFYEQIYEACRHLNGLYPLLGAIALLKYKSPTLIIPNGRLVELAQELTNLEKSGISHPQIAEFRGVCTKAISDGCALTISGDMYPEL